MTQISYRSVSYLIINASESKAGLNQSVDFIATGTCTAELVEKLVIISSLCHAGGYHKLKCESLYST